MIRKMIVMKFGGTSLASTVHIAAVAARVVEKFNQGFNPVVVVSAMAGETNRLLDLTRAQDVQATGLTQDFVVSTGEQITAGLMAIALEKRGFPARPLTGAQAGIITDRNFGDSDIIRIETHKIVDLLNQGTIPVVTGFQGISEEGDITTLGRGGSDTTAVALAAALMTTCEIYTDVEGVFTADPMRDSEAKKFAYVTYDQMQVMADSGAKVLHGKCVRIAKEMSVPIHVRSSFSRNQGTWIGADHSSSNQNQLLEEKEAANELS